MKFAEKDLILVNDLNNLIFEKAGTDTQILELLKSRKEKINYAYYNDNNKINYILGENVAAFYSDLEECVFLAPDIESRWDKKHVLMHEICHAYSKANDCTGFFNNRCYSVKDGDEPMDLISMLLYHKKGFSYVYANENRVINEAATEFYASEFLNEEPVSYHIFLPIYANLSEVCGHEKLKLLYFNHNDREFIKTIQESYNLKDDYLVKKLFMLLDASCNINGMVSDQILKYAYQTYLDMNINKVMFEHKDDNPKNYINVKKLIAYKGAGNEDNEICLDEICVDMEKHLNEFDGLQDSGDIEKTRSMVNEFVCKRMNDENMKYIGYEKYKDYFMKNMGDVLTYLNQEIYFKINGQLLEDETPINTVMNFISSFKDEIDYNALSKSERNCIAANLFSTKHDLFHFGNKNLDQEISL